MGGPAARQQRACRGRTPGPRRGVREPATQPTAGRGLSAWFGRLPQRWPGRLPPTWRPPLCGEPPSGHLQCRNQPQQPGSRRPSTAASPVAVVRTALGGAPPSWPERTRQPVMGAGEHAGKAHSDSNNGWPSNTSAAWDALDQPVGVTPTPTAPCPPGRAPPATWAPTATLARRAMGSSRRPRRARPGFTTAATSRSWRTLTPATTQR